jgi:hypothetical protein
MPYGRNFLLVFLALGTGASAFGHEARLELGGYRTVSNRFNIPNPGGSRVSVSEDSLRFYGRVQGEFQVSDRGSIRVLVAPLQAEYSHTPSQALAYNGVLFPGGSNLDVTYRFNSYRLGYIHEFFHSETFRFRAGALGKIRQAKISIEGAGLRSTYTNVGFVPLLNVGAAWAFLDPLELRFDLDGLAARQGRAFDGALELFYRTQMDGSGLSGGIRVLEGGADNEKVNTFALIQYAFLAYTQAF